MRGGGGRSKLINDDMSLWLIAKIETERDWEKKKTIKIAEMKKKVSKGYDENLHEMKFQMAR